MKNIQIIDGADNCTFSVFQATDVEFANVFPEPGQDMEFAEDLTKAAVRALKRVWNCPIKKPDANGIHGTIFYEFERKRQYFPASKRECDWPSYSLNSAQRLLFGRDEGEV